jgi:hypothetical protein
MSKPVLGCKMLKRKTTCLLAVTILSSTALLGSPSQDQNAFVIVTPSEMPATIESATIRNNTGRLITTLTYTLKNASEHELHTFMIETFVINGLGYIMAGEGWMVSDRLSKGEKRQFSEALRNYVRPEANDKLLVVVSSVQNQEREWKVEGAEIRRSIREHFPLGVAAESSATRRFNSAVSSGSACEGEPELQPTSLRNVRWVPLQSCPISCKERQGQALADCNSQGCRLCSFSCSQTSCNYNFTCCGGACK